MYYLRGVVAIIREFQKNIIFSSLDCFFINQSFEVALLDFKFEYKNIQNEHKTEENLRRLFFGLDFDFSRSLDVILADLDHQVDTKEFKREILKHKTAILDLL